MSAFPEDAGFDAFFERHYQPCYLVALRVTRNQFDAQDVAQSVFCKIWSAQLTIKFGSVEAWLVGVTKNAAIDVVRRRARERRYAASICGPFPHNRSAEHEALNDMESAIVSNALDVLNVETRALLQESFFEERSHSMIAKRRRMALGTVKSRIRAGLGRLRRVMKSRESYINESAGIASN